MPAKQVLVISNEQKRQIRESVNVTEEQVRNAVGAVLEWYKKQQHLPRIDLDPRIIESIFVSRKGSMEQTKQKIDMMYSLRNVLPEMAEPRDVLGPIIQNVMKGCAYVTLPKLNHDHTRIGLIQYRDVNFFNLMHIMNFVWATYEYRFLHDSFSGERYVFDLQGMTLGHIAKCPPTQIKNIETFIRNAFSIRIFGIHMVNGSTVVNALVTLFKSVLSEKLKSRIYVHSSLEDLYKEVDREILPADYGGDEAKYDELLENWVEVLGEDETRKYLISQEKLRSNESLRIGKLDEELLGVAGSFRTIHVD